MSEMDDKIADLCHQHDVRKQQERKERDAQLTADQDVKARIAELLQVIVLPVLRDVSASIRRAGKQSEVLENLDKHEPGASLTLTIDTNGSSLSSSISFQYSDPGEIEVHSSIYRAKSYESRKTLNPDEVCTQIVKDSAMNFVQSSLELDRSGPPK